MEDTWRGSGQQYAFVLIIGERDGKDGERDGKDGRVKTAV